MASFFETRDFIFFRKLRDRIKTINTRNNYEKYRTHRSNCIKLAQESYGNIGFREETGSYAWDSLDESELPPFMDNLGGYNEFSFYPGHQLFMAEDYSCMALKDSDGKVYTYSKEETEQIRDCSVAQLKKIHAAKVAFEGELVDVS